MPTCPPLPSAGTTATFDQYASALDRKDPDGATAEPPWEQCPVTDLLYRITHLSGDQLRAELVAIAKCERAAVKRSVMFAFLFGYGLQRLRDTCEKSWDKYLRAICNEAGVSASHANRCLWIARAKIGVDELDKFEIQADLLNEAHRRLEEVNGFRRKPTPAMPIKVVRHEAEPIFVGGRRVPDNMADKIRGLVGEDEPPEEEGEPEFPEPEPTEAEDVLPEPVDPEVVNAALAVFVDECKGFVETFPAAMRHAKGAGEALQKIGAVGDALLLLVEGTGVKAGRSMLRTFLAAAERWGELDLPEEGLSDRHLAKAADILRTRCPHA